MSTQKLDELAVMIRNIKNPKEKQFKEASKNLGNRRRPLHFRSLLIDTPHCVDDEFSDFDDFDGIYDSDLFY